MDLAELMPEPLLQMGPWGLAYWQWAGLGTAIVLAWLLGRFGARLGLWIAQRLAGKTESTLDDELVDRLAGPFRLLASVGLMRLALAPLGLTASAHKVVIDVLLALFAFTLVWGTLRAVDVMTAYLQRAQWATDRPAARAVVLLLSRIAKVLVIVIAGIGVLSGIGLPVASLLAGLGIGGIALAFGAQKTVENLFGAVSIGVDQPFRQGDFVRLDADVMGTIETIGLRSTRIRTLDRTMVTLPNGRLADMRIETFAARDRVRFTTVLNLVYGTTAAQLREVLAGFERTLREHPGVWKEDVTVRFMGFGPSSLDIEIIAFFATSQMAEFRAWRQEVLLGFMDVVEAAKTSFAFPTRTVHLVGEQRAS
jgi:MscS family membrane protein